MAISNQQVAAIFNQLADLLEIQGENPFRVRAYRNAAITVDNLSQNISDLVKEDFDFTSLPGIGEDLAEKIITLVKTGKLPLLDQIEKKFPKAITELLKIEGLGPKHVLTLYKKLHIKNIEDLQKAIEQGKIRKLKGFGKKTEEKVHLGLQNLKEYSKRMPLSYAFPTVNRLTNYIKKLKNIKDIACAGSFRRRKETIADLDFVVTASSHKSVINHFIKFEEITDVLSKGDTRSTVRLRSGLQVDLRVVDPKSYGAALFYFTGSKAHNIALRKIAVQQNLKINEYGVYKGGKMIAGRTEDSIYHLFGMEYIEPELREDRGEIAAALKHQLPKLVDIKNIRGDLHAHTKETDGHATLEAMALEAQKLGYDYLAITDHTKHLTVANGMDKKRLLAQIKLIDKLNTKFKNFTILKSAEVDILENGNLDLDDDILKELDLTVCSVHSKFNLSEKQQTERIIRAMDSKYFNILGHASGRLINRRNPYAVDMEKIMRAAKERGCILEVNAQPERLDLNDIHCQAAKAMKLKCVISSDAHSTSQLHNMIYGVYQARRGWLSASDVINTLSLDKLRKILKR